MFHAVVFALTAIFGPTGDATPSVEKPRAVAGEKAPAKSAKPADKGIKESSASHGPAKGESKWEKADKWIGRITGLLLSLFAVVLTVVGWTSKRGWAKAKRLQKILSYAEVAFDAVEALAKQTKWKGDDKLVEFLKRIAEMIRAEGDKPLSESEVELLKTYAARLAEKRKADK